MGRGKSPPPRHRTNNPSITVKHSIICRTCKWTGERAQNLPAKCPNCGGNDVVWDSTKQTLYTVLVDDEVNPARRVNYSAEFSTDPNSDDIVGEALSRGLIVPADTQHATGKAVDFTVVGGGSVFLLTPLTDDAKNWSDEHIDPEAQKLGNGIAVEHRYIGELVDGIRAEGFTII